MRRELRDPRPDYLQKVEQLGLLYHTFDDKPYWYESAAYVFEADEISELESATNTLHNLCLEAVEWVVTNRRYGLLSIPENLWKPIEKSWERNPPAIYGRFDLVFDGQSPPSMLEYNADTPTSLLEAAVVQWHWLQDVSPQADQFNSIWEGLVEKWGELKSEGYFSSGLVHFGCMEEPEDLMTTAILMDTATEAGLKVHLLNMRDIGWHDLDFRFVDDEARPMDTLFKLYPWEWLLSEEFGDYALKSFSTMDWIEPIWKMVLSNKGILAVLWSLFPGHENLLPAYLDGPRDLEDFVEKPILGREGANVRIVNRLGETCSDGDYGDGPTVFQAYRALPVFEGNHAVIGSWVIDGSARGIGIRESDGPITQDLARFVPHYFTPNLAWDMMEP